MLQPGLLCWDAIKSCTYGRGKEKTHYLYSLPYYRIIPSVSLSANWHGICGSHTTSAPISDWHFCLGYVVYINQVDILTLLLKSKFVIVIILIIVGVVIRIGIEIAVAVVLLLLHIHILL